MNLSDYDARIERAECLMLFGRKLEKMGQDLECEILRDAGIIYTSREPGFDCWKHKDLNGYYGTPREVIVALAKLERGIK